MNDIARRPRGRPKAFAPDTVVNQSLERAIGVLKTLAQHDGMSLTDLSDATGLAPSTTHRLLGTLAQHEMVVNDDTTQTWAIGLEALRIGAAFQRRTSLPQAGRAAMTELMESTGETVNMGLFDRSQVVFIDQVECREIIRAFFRIGDRRACHAAAIGKVLLAQRPEAEIEAMLSGRLERFTKATNTDPKALRAELSEIRSYGWALDDEEANDGMRSLAAPIFDEFGRATTALSISGPSSRLTQDKIPAMAEAVKRTADAITRHIGGNLLKA